MEIHMIPVVLHILLFGACFVLFWAVYRYVLHPDHRWKQRGNVCYENARNFAWQYSPVLFVVVEVLGNGFVVLVL
jgi:hypothetical protein